jgi:hypothetical protein
LAIFKSPPWTKTEFFSDSSLNSGYELFFRIGKSRKSGDFDQNDQNDLKSSFLSFIIRETSQNDAN